MSTIHIDNETPCDISPRMLAVIKLLVKNAGMINWIKSGSVELHIGQSKVDLCIKSRVDFASIQDD